MRVFCVSGVEYVKACVLAGAGSRTCGVRACVRACAYI